MTSRVNSTSCLFKAFLVILVHFWLLHLLAFVEYFVLVCVPNMVPFIMALTRDYDFFGHNCSYE